MTTNSEFSRQLIQFSPASDLLQNRVILISGAANGIGRAVAMACARHGARTLLLDIDRKGLERLYDKLEREGLPPATMIPMDLQKTDEAGYEELAHSLQQQFGRLDGLVHCAATLGALCPLEHYDATNWQRVMQVNLNAAYLLTRACLPLVRASNDASIIFTTADVARQARAYWGAYAIAGFAVEGMMQLWAKELSPDSTIRINSLDPGVVDTSMRSSAYPGEDRAQLKNADDVVNAYLYLLGEVGKSTSGQTLTASPGNKT
jgi:NAD(P)-dependent dehydrogenase (short-subunit alcohol dehydrogenase family)